MRSETARCTALLLPPRTRAPHNQTLRITTHIGRTVGQPNPHAGRRHDHRRTADMIRRKFARPTPVPTRTHVPSGSVISTRASSAGDVT